MSYPPLAPKRLAIIQRMRADGHTLLEIGARVGLTPQRVGRICSSYDIPAPKELRGARHIRGRTGRRPARPLRIDFAKAAAITESKRRWWEQQERSA